MDGNNEEINSEAQAQRTQAHADTILIRDDDKKTETVDGVIQHMHAKVTMRSEGENH